MSLFARQEEDRLASVRPLAARMRPQTLGEFVGQQHFLGEGKLLHRLLQADRVASLIFYGPPGTGKTTLAGLVAHETSSIYRPISAVTSNVKELRAILAEANDEVRHSGKRTLLFVDEIHRFNKSQQDVLLHDVEDGVIVLVGATTSNPFFAVNSALTSRSQIFEFRELVAADIEAILHRALTDAERGLGTISVDVDPAALAWLADACDGDARRALNALEVAVLSSSDTPVSLTTELLAESMQRKAIAFDPTGDSHYDLASALIKSIRGSDADASIYWLARLLESGEEIRFLTRRLVILASEDIGNADPQALPLAVATMQACEFVGLPECQLTLAQAVTYLACAPKSNAATRALDLARQEVQEGRLLPVPPFLRDGHYAGAERLGHGQGYVYAHDAPTGVVAQDYLGAAHQFYHPVDRGFESELQRRLQWLRRQLRGDDRSDHS
ncbi:MAG: replication-associated recombination protein A [Planctomycetota bacterium]